MPARTAKLPSFAATFSVEATRPNPDELRDLAGILRPGTPVYLSSVPTQSYGELARAAALVRNAGLEPVPHIAARRMPSADVLQDFLSRAGNEANVRRLLIVGGDVDKPAGPFNDALALLRTAKLREAGIEEVGITGYPAGHPKISPDAIAQALDAKIAIATVAGLKVHIVSQFCFDPAQIADWLRRLRAAGFRQPVKVGMAGPTSIPALLRYAKRCGVNASLRGLMSGAAAELLGHVGPDRIIAALDAAGDLGDIAAHYFSFGGLADTARFAADAARGHLEDQAAMAQPG